MTALGAPHTQERSEADVIAGFVARIEELRPQLVSFNGHGFDLPVLRYRAMINKLSAPGLECRSYFNRYSEDCLDLCDALSSFNPSGKMSLDALCRVLELPGKPEGVDGSQVAHFVRQGADPGGRRLLRDGRGEHLSAVPALRAVSRAGERAGT